MATSTTPKKPLVTIGITCFNAADTIVRAVMSALTQDWPNIEVIVVDDKSADHSVEMLNEAFGNIERVRLICHEENTGPAGARNTILAHARGEFVCFLDDDDRALATRVTEQVRTLEACERRTSAELVACYASGRRQYPNGYTKLLRAIGSDGEETPNGASVADYLLFFGRRPDWFYGSGIPACSLLARRSTFAAVDGFDASLRRVEDIDLAVRLALKGAHFVGTSAELFVQHATDAPDKSPEKNLEAELRLADKFEPYLRSIGRYRYARNWPKVRYWHFKRRYGRFLLELAALFIRHPISVTSQLAATGPQRLRHERRMRQENGACG